VATTPQSRLIHPKLILDMAVRNSYSGGKKNLSECILCHCYAEAALGGCGA
jgi:hypothetical protein